MPVIDADDLLAFATRILVGAGLMEKHAAATASGLICANLRGVDSHGILRLPQYVQSIEAGEINPAPRVKIAARRGATALIDADGGYGYGPSRLAADTAVELAKVHGVGFVGVCSSHHFGMAAEYVLQAAGQGFAAWMTTTSSAVIAPTGGARAVVGNNPIAWAIPRQPPSAPIVLDMALSRVAFGRIRLAATERQQIPVDWGFDELGNPTTDPAAALKARLLAPIGDYKGYGLALISEIIAGVMTGSPFATAASGHLHRGGGVGHAFIAIDPSALVSREEFEIGVERLVEEVLRVPLAPGATSIALPGDLERSTHARRSLEGIPVSDDLVRELDQLATTLRVAPLIQ